MTFGDYGLLLAMSRGESVRAPSFVTELERSGLAQNVYGLFGITGAGLTYLKTRKRPAFPKLGRVDDNGICPRCDFPYPISLCVGESQ